MTAAACLTCGALFIPGTSPAGLCPACLLTTALAGELDSEIDNRSQTLPPGTTVGAFQLVGVLGQGGMATVYEAYDPRLERAVALKVLPPEFLHDATFARRFEKEARVIARLEHRNIVPIYASGVDDGIPWMCMRLLSGGTVGGLLKNQRPDPAHVVRMLRGCAEALDYAHAHGVVHRDIKPTNLLLDESSHVSVADFGLAQMLERGPGLTRTGTLAGTPQYMAPEQATGAAVDRHSDIYSLGIVAYEMFVGDVPFTADSPIAVLMKHVNEPLPEPPAARLPPAVLRAIQRATAKNPADRWPSAGAFIAALEASVGVTDEPASHRVTGADHPVRARLGQISVAVGVVLVAAGLTWFMARDRTLPPSPAVTPASERALDTALPASRTPAAQQISAAPTASTPAPNPQRASPPAESSSPPRRGAIATEAIGPVPVPPVADALLQAPIPQPTRTAEDIRVAAEAAARPAVTTPAAMPVADVVTAPIRTRMVQPEYPAIARAAELEGDVVLGAIVGVDGKVRQVELLQSVHPVLDEAARKAVLQYEYLPGRRNGIPEAATIRIAVSFRLH